MKVLQTRYLIISILLISLMGSSILSSIPDSSAQEDTKIPDWIKNTAGWWSNGEISEREFLAGIEYLINNNIISIEPVPCFDRAEDQTISTNLVPDWVKNNAGWWAENLIDNADFYNGIEYLIDNHIIKIDNKKIQGNVPLEDITFSTSWITNKDYLVFIQSAFFEIYGTYGNCTIEDGKKIWKSLALGLDPNKMPLYDKVAVWNDPQKTVVVYPYLTYAAYDEPGFYTYYRGQCDTCTTTSISKQPTPLYTSSGMAHQALTLLGYASISDIQIDKNPDILFQYDKVILLHSEYVTRAMFGAITTHPNVIYLYPNALYAEIEIDYVNETMTLIRGHDYPPEDPVSNGFDWEFDNTHPYEYDSKCETIDIYKIDNGVMTTCYPENLFLKKSELLFNTLKFIKEYSGE